MSLWQALFSLALSLCICAQSLMPILPLCAKESKHKKIQVVENNQTEFLFELNLLDRLIDTGKFEEALAFAQNIRVDVPIMQISLNYRLSAIYANLEKPNESKKFLEKALRSELAIDQAMEQEDRKKIHPNEFKSGNLESIEKFKHRYEILQVLRTESDLSTQCKYRARLLLLRQRYLDCYYLCLARQASVRTKDRNSLSNIRSIAAMYCHKPYIKVDYRNEKSSQESLFKNALQAEMQGHFDYARKLYELSLETKPQDFCFQNMARLAIARCFRKERQFEQAVLNYKLVYDEANGKTKGMAESLAYKSLFRQALEGLEYYGADTAHLILHEKESDFKALCDADKLKYLERLYDAGYKLKAAGHGRKTQEMLWLCLTLYRKYFPQEETAIAGVLYDLSESYYWNEAYDPAMELMEQCIDLRSRRAENLDALDTLGRIYMASTQSKKGLQAFERLLFLGLKEYAPDTVSQYELGHVNNLISIAISVRPRLSAQQQSIIDMRLQAVVDGLIAHKEFDQALALASVLMKWKETEKKTNSNAIMDSLWQIGWLSRVVQKNEEAKNCYTRLIEEYPNRSAKWLATWHFERGLAFDCMGDYKSAIKDFQIALFQFRKYFKAKQSEMDFDEKEYLVNIICDLDLELKYKKIDPPNRDDYLRSFPMYIYRWNKSDQPLRIYIDKSEKSGFGPKLTKVIDAIVRDWMDTKGLPLTWTYSDSPKECDIHIKRASDYDDIPAGSGGRAKSELVFREKGEMKELYKSTLLIYCPSYDGEDLSFYGMQQMKNLAMHEFGHALGLGHSPNGLDIMYWKAPALQLSARDRNTLIHLYSK